MNGQRTPAQNDKLHPMCRDISRQVRWMVNGQLQSMHEDEWRAFFVGHIRKQKVVPTIDGDGLMMLGGSSRRLNKSEMGDCFELIYAFGTERGVVWTDPAIAALEQYPEARRA